MDFKIFALVGALFLASVLVDQADSANILVVTFFSSKSHKITYMHLVEELGKRGHNITVVSPVKPMKEMKNVKEIYTLDVEQIFQGNKFDAFEAKATGQTVNPSQMIKMIYETCDQTYDLPQVRALLNEKFDLILYQPMFNDCVLGLIYRLQAPFVLFTPTQVPSWILGQVGGHYPPSFLPNVLLGYPPEMTFYQRFVNFGATALMEGYISFVYERQFTQLYREKLGDDIPAISEILQNASFVLANTHFSLSGPMPYLPDVVDVGGIHSRPAKPIPKDLEDFVQKGGKDGFILFSMDSAIKGDQMPEAKRKMILKVFSQLKQQVLWKWESETMPDLPKNVKLSKWLPQQDLLGHKDIKMFITHCGGGSTEEAIYHAVPLVGLPMMADQPKNANLAKKHGYIVDLNWNELTEDDFMGAIQEILNNPKYRENVKKLSTLFKDRPVDPLELGVYWVEYVLRHKGAPHLRSVGRKLNLWQYHSYDVIGAYLAIIATLLYLIFVSVRFICRKTCCRSSIKQYNKGVASGKKIN